MENGDLSEDQKVFDFLHSKNFISIFELENYLRNNNLPIKEKWLYYSLGQQNMLDWDYDEDSSSSNNNKRFIWPKHTRLGFDLLEEFNTKIQHWDDYLDNEQDLKEGIIEELNKEGIIKTNEEIHIIFIKKGYIEMDDYVRFLDDLKWEPYIQEYHWRRLSLYKETYEDPICGACDESPCMCSDRERTSTVHDF